jgi:hypothetical protein
MRQLEQSDGQDALRQNRADLGIAEESRFQGLGISAVIFNPPFMLSNVKLTPQLDLGSAKTGHCQFQIRPLGVETGQYLSRVTDIEPQMLDT